MRADDLKLIIVGSNVPSTNQLSLEQMRIDDPNRNPKKSDIKQPANLGFEDGTILWLYALSAVELFLINV